MFEVAERLRNVKVSASAAMTRKVRELRAQGVEVAERQDGFIIEGGGSAVRAGAPVDPHGDHRLAMALAVLGLGAQQALTIRGAEIMRESFPEFVEGLLSLGAGLQALTGPLRRRLPVLTSLLVVGVGLATIFGRLSLPVAAAAPGGPDSMNHLVNRVKALDSSEMPCCDDR